LLLLLIGGGARTIARPEGRAYDEQGEQKNDRSKEQGLPPVGILQHPALHVQRIGRRPGSAG
jgi:hypothetical protein